jgi:hypothetical protein
MHNQLASNTGYKDMQVKCIDDTAGYGFLKKRSVYIVERELEYRDVLAWTIGDALAAQHDGCYLLQGSAIAWLTSRFEIVADTSTATHIYVKCTTAVSTPTPTVVDPVEERCWAAMRPKDPEDFCPCGCHKLVCSFHKDM